MSERPPRARCDCGRLHERFHKKASDGTEMSITGCPDCFSGDAVEALAYAARKLMDDAALQPSEEA